MTMDASTTRSPLASDRRVSVVDLLDRVLATGVVVTGDVTLSIADVDLVRISLRTIIESIGANGASQAGSPTDGR